MANFSLFETFFFITLVITFILILLLVYHFKQRITTMEERCDKMFDIIQTMSQELNRQHAPMGNFHLSPPQFVKLDNTVENDMVDVINFNEEKIYENTQMENYVTHVGNEHIETDDDTESGDDADDEESVESVESVESEDDDESVEDVEELKITKIEGDEVSLEQIENSIGEEDKMEIYKKMSVNELKQKVIEKGLSTNTGKLKKGDLLSLLENE